MDVVNLVYADSERQEATKDFDCIVSDDINRFVQGRRREWSIYVIFKEDVTLTEPFKLFCYQGKESVRILDRQAVQSVSHELWTDRCEDAPLPTHKKDGLIKLNFFQSPFKERSLIEYTWFDVHTFEEPSAVRLLDVPQNASLHLVIPLNHEDIAVLTDKMYSAYLQLRNFNGNILPTPITCLICWTCSTSMVMLRCGHCHCEICLARHEKCSLCPETNVECELRLRHGPCPIDICTAGDDVESIVLVPCGCYLHCKKLADAVEKHKNNSAGMQRILSHCPYDACGRQIEEFRAAFHRKRDDDSRDQN